MSWAEEKTLEQFIKDTTGPNAGPMLFGNFPSNVQAQSVSKHNELSFLEETEFFNINGRGWIIGSKCIANSSIPATYGKGSIRGVLKVYVDGEPVYCFQNVVQTVFNGNIQGNTTINNLTAETSYNPNLLTINRSAGAETIGPAVSKTVTVNINAPFWFNQSLRATLTVSHVSGSSDIVEKTDVVGIVYYVLSEDGGGVSS